MLGLKVESRISKANIQREPLIFKAVLAALCGDVKIYFQGLFDKSIYLRFWTAGGKFLNGLIYMVSASLLVRKSNYILNGRQLANKRTLYLMFIKDFHFQFSSRTLVFFVLFSFPCLCNSKRFKMFFKFFCFSFFPHSFDFRRYKTV